MVSISSCWHRAKRSRLEMDLGQKMHWIFLRLVVWKDNSLAWSCLSQLPAFLSVQKGWQYTALVELQLSLAAVLWWPPDCIQTPNGVSGFAQPAVLVLVGTAILSDSAAHIGEGLCTGKGWSSCQTGAGAVTFKVMTSVFLLLICSLTCLPHLLRWHVFFCMSWCVCDSSTRSLVKSRSSSVSKSVYLISLSWSSVVHHITHSITRLKRTADMTHPWCMPVLILKFRLFKLYCTVSFFFLSRL